MIKGQTFVICYDGMEGGGDGCVKWAMMVMVMSDEGSFLLGLLFGKEGVADGGQQLFKQQSYP